MRRDEPAPNRIFADADATALALEADGFFWNAIYRARRKLQRPLTVQDVKAASREATPIRRRHEAQQKRDAAKAARQAKRPLTRTKAVCKMGSGVRGPSVEEVAAKSTRRIGPVAPIFPALVSRALGVRKVG